VPTYATNCIDDWEAKIAAIVQETKGQDLRLVSGIPPWVQMFFEQLKKVTGKKPVEVWPNLQLFVHGGVDYRPYQDIFFEALGKEVDLLETFPASEGFFAIQTRVGDNQLQLMPDYGIFYEFIPLSAYGQPDAPRLHLGQVEVGVDYAMVISTNAGMWAYDLGDTVRFSSVKPPRLRVSGRVKHFISAFGEHVIQEEVNNAMLFALHTTRAQMLEFTVAPFVSDSASYHEWFVEFTQLPDDMHDFCRILDSRMREQNPYYDDLRKGGMLQPAVVRVLQPEASRAYMKAQGKLGGQNKYPRLSNNRKIADALQPWIVR
jgi:hypothetical protein